MQENLNTVAVKIGPETKLIISTSGRVKSLKRNQVLLQEILGLDIAYIPIISDTPDNKINPLNFAKAIRGLSAIGGAISKDIKEEIVPYLDKIDKLAKKVKSVNTVIREKNKLIGYNTDLYGFHQAIKNNILDKNISIKTALIYGYGGIFNVIYSILSSLGIEVYLTGRNKDKIQEKVKKFKLKPYDDKPKDLFINAALISDHPLEQAVNFLESIKQSKIVFDLNMPGDYLYDYCQTNGINYIPGTEMYYPQMYKQLELFLKDLVKKDDIPGLVKQAEKAITQ